MSVGTPDYTRGVVNAQKLVGSFGHSVTNAPVTIPPNAETLVVVIPSAPANQACGAEGNTTAASYPAIRAGLQGGSAPSAVFFIDVSSAIDPVVNINIAPAAPVDWFVYADAGTHLTADIGGVLDSQGKHFTVPTVPGGTSFDHPPTEIKIASFGNTSVTTNILNAPGALFRYRVFGAWVTNATASDMGIVQGTYGGGTCYLAFSIPPGGPLQIPTNGLPLDANTPIQIGCYFGAAGAFWGSVLYTIELV